MDVKDIPAIHVLQASRELRLPEAGAWLARTLPEIDEDIDARRLPITGPWIFVSFDLPRDATTPFTLQLCRPVARGGDPLGRFRTVTLPAFRCASIEYEGPLSGIHTGGYVPLLDAIFAEGLPLTGEIREVHHVRDTPESPINQVEIQIGIRNGEEARVPDHPAGSPGAEGG